MEIPGACWECGCEEFTQRGAASESAEQTALRAIRVGLSQVEDLREIVARLRAQLGHDEQANGRGKRLRRLAARKRRI